MERDFLSRAILEGLRYLLFSLLFCLLAEALFAVFVQAFSPAGWIIVTVNWAIQLTACLLGGALFLHAGRVLFKGLICGAVSVLVTMIVFGAIGGFSLTPFFILKLILGAVLGAAGGILGVKLRKE